MTLTVGLPCSRGHWIRSVWDMVGPRCAQCVRDARAEFVAAATSRAIREAASVKLHCGPGKPEDIAALVDALGSPLRGRPRTAAERRAQRGAA